MEENFTDKGHSLENENIIKNTFSDAQDLSGVIKFKPEITYNTSRTTKTGKKAPDGIELRFGSVRPTAELREKLKAQGFQFSEKQIIWYALDNSKSRELVEYLENNEIEADDNKYEKRHLWAKVGSMDFYNKLTNFTEFMVSGTPPQFYRNKKQLESKTNVKTAIYSDHLKFKKFYNKIVGDDEQESGDDNEEESEKENENEDNDQEEETSTGKPNLPLAEKLKELADGLQKFIDAKLNSATSRQRPTAKRLRVASAMRQDGYYLQNIQKVLYALSKAQLAGKINAFSFLKNIRSKSQVELINKFTDAFGKKHEDHYLQSVLDHKKSEFSVLGIKSIYDWSVANGQRFELLALFSDRATQQQTEQQRKIEELEIEIKSKKIEGFFPTPKKLIAELLSIAEIKKGDKILEPSAGKGDILDAIQERYQDTVRLTACEINYSLRELLKLKGYELIGTNFLEVDRIFDKIIMNPPFEKGQDIDHVLHALTLLNKGGRVVAVMSEGVFFRSFKKEKEFRNLLFHKNAFISEKITGAFKDAFNQTGITVRIVAINQDGSLPDLEDSYEINDDEQAQDYEESEDEHLELQALAELELLKMELELKQKKQHLNGLGEIYENTIYPAVWNIH
ncbi:MAG: N-6 DNA methylase [Bacteroidetes bacterium]|nr:N-6 DNA methylase [Bacteroidota bacterium]